jgi:hypothetical protein
MCEIRVGIEFVWEEKRKDGRIVKESMHVPAAKFMAWYAWILC